MKTPTTSPDDKTEEAVARALYAVEHKKINTTDFDQEAAAHRKYWLESARAAIAAYKKATGDAG